MSLDINAMNIDEAKAAMDQMTLDDAASFAETDVKGRKQIADYISKRQKAEAGEGEQAPVEHDPADDAPPMRFVALKGVPRIMTLIHTQKRSDPKDNGFFTVPATMMRPKKNALDPLIRVIDVLDMPEVRRADFPVEPEVVSAKIMETSYYRRGLIMDWDEYEERKTMEAEFAAEAQARQRAFEDRLAAKRGKRGATV